MQTRFFMSSPPRPASRRAGTFTNISSTGRHSRSPSSKAPSSLGIGALLRKSRNCLLRADATIVQPFKPFKSLKALPHYQFLLKRIIHPSLEPGKQLLADQFQALFVAVILESQVKYQVFDAARAKFFDLRGAVIRVAYDQKTFHVLNGLKLSGSRFYPVAASL